MSNPEDSPLSSRKDEKSPDDEQIWIELEPITFPCKTPTFYSPRVSFGTGKDEGEEE